MKIQGKKYTDISKVDVGPITSMEAKSMIVKYHYSHKWSGGIYSFGVYYNNLLVGCLSYAIPVGSNVVNTITKTFKFDKSKLYELRRLWVADGLGTNIESYSIGQSFKFLRKYGVDILVSYSDPAQKHQGKIYQATNWYYQGRLHGKTWEDGFIINGKKYHHKTILMKYGTKKEDYLRNLKKIDPNFKQLKKEAKHRYLYILNKKLKKKILSDLKYPILEYPK